MEVGTEGCRKTEVDRQLEREMEGRKIRRKGGRKGK